MTQIIKVLMVMTVSVIDALPSEPPGTIWLDLLAVQGTLKSLLQYHSSKASILQHSAFFTVQFSHSYMASDFGAPKNKV